MRKTAFVTLLAMGILVLVGGALLQSVLVLQRVAAIREVHGQVAVSARGSSEFNPVGDKPRVYAGDTVKTGDDGAMILEWLDGTRMEVGPNTIMTILKCQINKARNTEQSVFKLDAGRIWIRVIKALSGKSKFEVRTPTATAAVRGTVFAVAVDQDGATQVSVYEGQVDVNTGDASAKVPPNAIAKTDGNAASVDSFDAGETALWQQKQHIAEPILHIAEPAEGFKAAAGATIAIEGQSENGARVTVDGKPAELQIKQRFSAHVTVPSDFEGNKMIVTVTATDRRGYTAVRPVQIEIIK